MSSSIPIPPRNNPPSPRMDDSAALLGTSLPVRRLQLPASITASPTTRTSKDDLAAMTHGWVPQPSVELVSRAARKWQSHHPLSLPPSPLPPSNPRSRDALPSGFPIGRAASPPPTTSQSRLPNLSGSSSARPAPQRSPPPTPRAPLPSPSVGGASSSAPGASGHSPTNNNRPSRLRFDPWDFSEVVNATEEVNYAFETGSARATRPPRDGVSGTYFIRRNESHGDVLCVFKPVDEEAASIDLSPNFTPLAAPPQPPSNIASALSLGPAHGSVDQFPFAHSPPAPQHLSLQRSDSSSSSESEHSRSPRTNGFNAGEGAYKEAAAYLLDHDRFAGVPQTVLARCHLDTHLAGKKGGEDRRSHGSVSDHGDFEFEDEHSDIDDVFDEDHEFPSSSGDNSNRNGTNGTSTTRTKMGAFQVFIPNSGDADDFGPGVFDADQVHRIAVLDIRTLNHDRHGGNILVTKSKTRPGRFDLVPIDHGFILPEVIHGIPWPVWMDWPMAKQPLSDEVKTYIEYLDADKEARILTEELDGVLRPGSLQALKIATALLQKGVAAGLTLHDIGLLMYIRRDNPMQMSELQKIVAEAIKVGETRHSHLGKDLDSGATRRRNGVNDEHHNLHRRHQSMSAIYTHEAFVDDFIVKYAVKRITEVVARVAEEKARRARDTSGDRDAFKMNDGVGNGVGGGAKLTRARSIPDFGIGVRPVHTLLSRNNNHNGNHDNVRNGRPIPEMVNGLAVPTPTPASSPTYSRTGSHDGEAVGGTGSAGVGIGFSSIVRPAVRQSPIDIPLSENNVRRMGLVQQQQQQTHPIGVGVPRLGESERIGSGGELPPLFKRGSSERKPSPMAPMELVNWNGGTP